MNLAEIARGKTDARTATPAGCRSLGCLPRLHAPGHARGVMPSITGGIPYWRAGVYFWVWPV